MRHSGSGIRRGAEGGDEGLVSVALVVGSLSTDLALPLVQVVVGENVAGSGWVGSGGLPYGKLVGVGTWVVGCGWLVGILG